jgi:hypothetical protein
VMGERAGATFDRVPSTRDATTGRTGLLHLGAGAAVAKGVRGT